MRTAVSPMKSDRRRILFALALPLLAGCASTTQISRLLDDPSHFDGRTVHVEGKVTGSVGLLGRGAYRLDDDTGVLTIVSDANGVPRKGAHVRVQGKFQSVFTVNEQAGAVLLEEKRSSR